MVYLKMEKKKLEKLWKLSRNLAIKSWKQSSETNNVHNVLGGRNTDWAAIKTDKQLYFYNIISLVTT